MKILFTGDVMLGRTVNAILKTHPPEYPWGDTLPLFNNADLRICNLECVISERGQPWSVTPKIFHFRTDTKNIESLKIAGINLISLANNHTLDFEYEAMLEMLSLLDKIGIAYAGAGKNLSDASQPSILEKKELRIGFIAFTDNEPYWEAITTKPGIFYLPIDLKDPRAKKLMELTRRTKNQVDLLIVSAHWGPNWGYTPLPEHITFAHTLIEAGADIVFGHSPHIYRGIEVYKNKVIFYSTGNFIDDYAVDEIERNDQSFLFAVNFSKTSKQINLYPTVIRDYQARMATGYEAEEIILRMQNLCTALNTVTQYHKKEKCLEIQIE